MLRLSLDSAKRQLPSSQLNFADPQIFRERLGIAGIHHELFSSENESRNMLFSPVSWFWWRRRTCSALRFPISFGIDPEQAGHGDNGQRNGYNIQDIGRVTKRYEPYTTRGWDPSTYFEDVIRCVWPFFCRSHCSRFLLASIIPRATHVPDTTRSQNSVFRRCQYLRTGKTQLANMLYLHTVNIGQAVSANLQKTSWTQPSANRQEQVVLTGQPVVVEPDVP